MSDPITWRSINAPDFRASAASMAAAANTIDGAFGGLRTALNQNQADQEKLAAKRTKDNTAAYLTQLASFQDPAAAEAALKSGQLTEMLRGYGSEIDAPTAIAAQNSLVQGLQQRAVQAMQFQQEGQKFKDYQTDLGQRDTVNALQEALQRASTPDEVGRIKQALGIYQDQGYVDGRAGVDIIKNATLREGNLVTEARAAEKHTREGTKLDADLAHQKEQERIARGQLSLSQQNANTNATQAAANLERAVAGDRIKIAMETNKDVQKMREAAAEAEKNSPFGGNSFNSKDLKEIYTFAKATGVEADDVGSFIKDLTDKYKNGVTLPSGQVIPISNQLVQKAIAAGAGTGFWSLSTKLNGRDSEMMDAFDSMVKAPGFENEYVAYLSGRNALAANIKAIKEAGQAEAAAIRQSTQPYLDKLGAHAGVVPPKR